MSTNNVKANKHEKITYDEIKKQKEFANLSEQEIEDLIDNIYYLSLIIFDNYENIKS